MAWSTSDEEDLENYRDLTKHLAPRLFFNDPTPVGRTLHRALRRCPRLLRLVQRQHLAVRKARGEVRYRAWSPALPNYSSLIKFMPNAWPIKDHAEDWIFHKLQIPEAMRAWGDRPA
jgi:hypothetical protein